MKADSWQVQGQGYGSRKTATLAIGGQAEVVPGLYLGAHAYNLNQAKLAEYDDERIPTIMKAGLSYRPYEKLMINVESEKGLDHKADFKAGAEYLLEDIIYLRTGFSSLSRSVTGGVGIKYRNFKADYALGNQSQLGFSNYMSVAYEFK